MQYLLLECEGTRSRGVLRVATSLIHLLAVLGGMWAYKGILRCLQALLVFGVDPRPKVRKAAQQVLTLGCIASTRLRL